MVSAPFLELNSIADKFKSATSQPLKKCQRLVFVPSGSNMNSTSAMKIQELVPTNATAEDVEEGWVENINKEKQENNM
ncbi:9928_t:CDS:2, partial [Gigaspora margarita]